MAIDYVLYVIPYLHHQDYFGSFSRFLDVLEMLIGYKAPSELEVTDRVFIPRNRLAALIFRDWRRINIQLLWEMMRRKIVDSNWEGKEKGSVWVELGCGGIEGLENTRG